MQTDLPLVFRRKLASRVVGSVVLFVCALLFWAVYWDLSVFHAGAAPAKAANGLQVQLYFWMFLLLSIFVMAAAIRGVGQLTIDRDGLTMRRVFRGDFLPWNRVGGFTRVIANRGLRRGELVRAWAPVACVATDVAAPAPQIAARLNCVLQATQW